MKSNFNTVIYGIAVTPDNDLLMVTDASTLKQIKSGTNFIEDAVYSLDPFEPVSIHVTKRYKVIVWATVLNTDKGMVIVMDHKGNREKVYGEGHTERVSMFYPSKITATSDTDIFVIDRVLKEKKERKESDSTETWAHY